MAYWKTALFPSSGKYECANAHDNTLIIAVPSAQRPQSCPCEFSGYVMGQDWILTPLRPDLFRDSETAQPRFKAGSFGLTGRIHGFPATIQSELRIVFLQVYADSFHLPGRPGTSREVQQDVPRLDPCMEGCICHSRQWQPAGYVHIPYGVKIMSVRSLTRRNLDYRRLSLHGRYHRSKNSVKIIPIPLVAGQEIEPAYLPSLFWNDDGLRVEPE